MTIWYRYRFATDLRILNVNKRATRRKKSCITPFQTAILLSDWWNSKCMMSSISYQYITFLNAFLWLIRPQRMMEIPLKCRRFHGRLCIFLSVLSTTQILPPWYEFRHPLCFTLRWRPIAVLRSCSVIGYVSIVLCSQASASYWLCWVR